MNKESLLPIGAGETILEDAEKEIRQEIKLQSLTGLNPHFRYILENNEKYIKVLGASGTETSDVNNLKMMTDPVTPSARKDMRDCAYTSTVFSPSFERRSDAQFEDGYTLELELTMKRSPETDKILTPEESLLLLDQFRPDYLTAVNILRKWEKKMGMDELMSDFTVHELDQGRCATFYHPGIFELQEISNETSKPLPTTLEIVPAEDLKEPIVDTSSGNKLVAVNTDWKIADSDKKRIIRKDEMVYGVRRNYMLRKDSRFFGSSVFEPVLIMSNALKRLYNFDIPDGIVSSIITKIIFQFSNTQIDSATITAFVNDYLRSGKKAYGLNKEVTPIPVAHKIDGSFVQTAEKILTDTLGAVLGVPKSMLNKETGLNRSIAEAELIQFIKYVRKPDERHVSKLFEDQLLNPLFAYLCNKKIDEMPVKIKIIPVKDPDDIIQQLLEEKAEKIDSGQTSEIGKPSHVIGAAGKDLKKKLNQSLEEQYAHLLKK